jgi:DNA-binding transcriptional LysR family regulator
MSREYYARPVLDIRMLAVAHRDHALHSLGRPPSHADLIRHTIVTIEGVAGGVPKRQPRSPAQRFLAVTSIEAAVDAVRSGFCFGWLPVYRITMPGRARIAAASVSRWQHQGSPSPHRPQGCEPCQPGTHRTG